MRRLPIYFLIDVSESMVGEPIELVEKGVESIIKELRLDPQALETVWISIIVFAGKAKTIMPLQEISSFYPPRFPIGSGTSLGAGIAHLSNELDIHIVRTTAETKGDWKPIVFILTDGVPTDDSKPAISNWKAKWGRSSNVIATTIGDSYDAELFRDLTEDVVRVEDASVGAFSSFIKWLTASIKMSSVSVETTGSDLELAEISGDGLSRIDLSKEKVSDRWVDDNYIILTGKCQNTDRPYLIKYKRQDELQSVAGMAINTGGYRLVGGFPLSETYNELSDGLGAGAKVNTNLLEGAPSCPCCGNQFSFAACGCGGIHCIGREVKNTCPWCGNIGDYTAGDGSFDIERSQG